MATIERKTASNSSDQICVYKSNEKAQGQSSYECSWQREEYSW